MDCVRDGARRSGQWRNEGVQVRAGDSLVRSVSRVKNRSTGKTFLRGEVAKISPEIGDGENLCGSIFGHLSFFGIVLNIAFLCEGSSVAMDHTTHPHTHTPLKLDLGASISLLSPLILPAFDCLFSFSDQKRRGSIRSELLLFSFLSPYIPDVSKCSILESSFGIYFCPGTFRFPSNTSSPLT